MKIQYALPGMTLLDPGYFQPEPVSEIIGRMFRDGPEVSEGNFDKVGLGEIEDAINKIEAATGVIPNQITISDAVYRMCPDWMKRSQSEREIGDGIQDQNQKECHR